MANMLLVTMLHLVISLLIRYDRASQLVCLHSVVQLIELLNIEPVDSAKTIGRHALYFLTSVLPFVLVNGINSLW